MTRGKRQLDCFREHADDGMSVGLGKLTIDLFPQRGLHETVLVDGALQIATASCDSIEKTFEATGFIQRSSN